MVTLGIDIGGGTIRAGLVDAAGRIAALASLPTPAGGRPRDLLAAVSKLVADVSVGCPAPLPVAGIGVPGLRAHGSQVLLRAVNLPELEGVDLQEFFETALKRRVVIDSDSVVAGYAQWRAAGAEDQAAHAPPPERFVYLSLGTGVGACVILNGQIVRHTRGGPGHLGHLIVDTTRDAPLCRCGVYGCLEAVVRHFSSENQGSDGVNLAALVHGLTTGLLQICHLYAPDEVRLGGGVIDHHPHVPELCGAELAKRGGTLGSATLVIRRGVLPTDRAGVIGAALLARE